MQLLENHKVFYKKKNLPELFIGDRVIVTIYLELPREQDDGKKKEKERTQAYEGVIISKHRNTKEPNATIIVRKVSQEVGIEKVFLCNSPWIKDIKIISRAKVRRAKLYYLRDRTGKSARLKRRF
uniref:ribosomal protein L19 n=1 Tax=Phaeocystis rex TaxID=1631189 RepID=UPI002411426E|nr:ribosomal protein L19 [Phaeocystis rex]WEL35901.1 ribosomal protein L19 [Phaeocystis rex]